MSGLPERAPVSRSSDREDGILSRRSLGELRSKAYRKIDVRDCEGKITIGYLLEERVGVVDRLAILRSEVGVELECQNGGK